MDFIMDTNRCVFYGFIHLHADRIRLHTHKHTHSLPHRCRHHRRFKGLKIKMLSPLPKRNLDSFCSYSLFRFGIQFDLDYIFGLKMYFCIISLCRLSSYVENKNPDLYHFTHNFGILSSLPLPLPPPPLNSRSFRSADVEWFRMKNIQTFLLSCFASHLRCVSDTCSSHQLRMNWKNPEG